ncbi:MAG TPA: two-component regulator propeller domain-containing protein [Cyclobacteriaceae bacterium]|nr:two-component regulator propeller domain-containing protein [Cyclobacteriaceae bacterium]
MLSSRLTLFLIFVFVCAGILPVNGQSSFTYRNYTESNGLPSSEIYQVYQDRSGFIWFGTDNGVARFDGKEFLTYRKSEKLPDQVVFGFHEDHSGRLWFRTFSGATAFFQNNELTPYKFNDTIKKLVGDEIMNGLAFDSLGRIIFSNDAISWIDSAGQWGTRENGHDALRLVRISAKAALLSYNGHNKAYDSSSIFGRRFVSKFTENKDNNAVPCFQFWKGKILVSVGHDLFVLEGSKVIQNIRSEHAIISLSVDKQDQLWIGMIGAGVSRYTNSLDEIPFRMNLLDSKSVTSVMHDSELGYWFSTLEKGVYYLPNLEMLNYPMDSQTKISGVVFRDNYFVTGNYLGEVESFDFKTRKPRWKVELHNPVMAMLAPSHSDKIWVSTISRTYILTKDGKVWKEYPEIKSVKSFFEDAQGRIWGVSRVGVLSFSSEGTRLKRKEIGFWPRAVLVDGAKLLVAGVTGLFVSDTSITRFRPVPEFKDYKINQMLNVAPGLIVLGTAGNGLQILQDGKVLPDRFNALLRGNQIHTMLLADTCLWLGTDGGLNRIPTQTLVQGTPRVYAWDHFNGLLSDKVNHLACSSTDLSVFFDGGYTVIPETIVSRVTPEPQFYFISRTVNNRIVSDQSDLTLKHTDNNITIHYGFIGYQNRFAKVRHRLNDESAWNSIDNGAVSYYGLAPGEYQIQMEYSLDGVHWSRASFPSCFAIAPPWWGTVYFQLGVLVMVGIIVYLIFLIRARMESRARQQDRKFQNRLREQRESIAKDLHDNIGNQLTSLSLGLHHLEKGRDLTLVGPLQEEIHSTMTELRDTIWAMHQQRISVEQLCDKLRNLVWRHGHHHATGIACHFELPPETAARSLQPAQAINIFRILQEAVSNALKHGQATSISIKVQYTPPDAFEFVVMDNGVGFDLPVEFIPDHYGLGNMRKRAEEIQATFSLQSEKGKGTAISLGVRV